MLPPMPVIEPPLPFGVLDLAGPATTAAIAAAAPAPWAEQPEQTEEQERNEDETGEDVPVVLDHDRLPVGRRDHLGMVGTMVAPIAIPVPGGDTDRDCDR